MRYIESPELMELGTEMSRPNPAGDMRVRVGIELYTTKPASSDRRLQRTLDHQLDQQLDGHIDSSVIMSSSYDALNSASYLLSPPTSDPNADRKRRANSTESMGIVSPFGPLDQGGNRKQYAYLIGVLNASDPDRDFSSLPPELFRREWEPASKVAQTINSTLSQALGTSQVPAELWDVIGREVEPRECKIYSLTLPQQFLQDDDSGAVWAKMWFFFNKRRKRVLFLHVQTQRLHLPTETEDEDDAILGELD